MHYFARFFNSIYTESIVFLPYARSVSLVSGTTITMSTHLPQFGLPLKASELSSASGTSPHRRRRKNAPLEHALTCRFITQHLTGNHGALG